MSLRRSTALTLVTVVITLGATVPALAMPARDARGSSIPAAVVLSSPAPPAGHQGVGTLVVVLLATGALLAGAAAGFGGARVSAGRSSLRPR